MALTGRSSASLARLALEVRLPTTRRTLQANRAVINAIGRVAFNSWSASRPQWISRCLGPRVGLITSKGDINRLAARLGHSSSSKHVVPFILSDIGEGTSEVEIKEWLVKVGDNISQFDSICEVESDKTTATISSRYDGVITKIHYQVGDLAKVGKPLVDIEVSGEPSKGTAAGAESQNQPTVTSPDDVSSVSAGGVDSSPTQISTLPSVRRLAKEHGIDLNAVLATGRHGRILRDDVIAYLQAKEATGVGLDDKCNVRSASPPPQTQPSTGHKVERIELETVVPLRGIRRAMYKTMTKSLTIPHFNYSDEIDLSQLLESIRCHRQRDAQDRVGVFAYIIKMVSLALRDYPELNASLDPSGEFMVQKHFHNIGIAVDTQAGLVVPNIKNVQNLSVREVHSELLRLRELGYAGKLSQSDMTGATISLSNIGAIGGVFGVPVIVSPEILIGAIGKTRKLPRFNATGQVEAREIMQVVWSADHRVVDGATLSRFSNLLKLYLEEPAEALLKLN